MTHEPADTPSARRRWLQFGLRTALWLVVMTALGLVLWRDGTDRDRRIKRLELLLEAQLLLSQHEPVQHVRTSVLDRKFTGSSPDAHVKPLPGFFEASGVPLDGQQLRLLGQGKLVPKLTGMLTEADATRRAQAAYSFALLGPGFAPVPELKRALADPERSVRWHALLALGRCGPDAAPAADAVRRLMNDDDSGMPAFAAQTLLRIDPDAPVTERLIAVLDHSRADTRRRALDTLSELNNEAARAVWPTMVALLEDDDEGVRLAAIEAVATLAPCEPAIEAITALLRNEVGPAQRRLAADRLLRLNEQALRTK